MDFCSACPVGFGCRQPLSSGPALAGADCAWLWARQEHNRPHLVPSQGTAGPCSLQSSPLVSWGSLGLTSAFSFLPLLHPTSSPLLPTNILHPKFSLSTLVWRPWPAAGCNTHCPMWPCHTKCEAYSENDKEPSVVTFGPWIKIFLSFLLIPAICSCNRKGIFVAIFC